MAWMEVVDGMHAAQSQRSWSRVGRCRKTSRVRGDTPMTPDHTAGKCASLDRVEPELVGLPRKAGTPREGSSSLSM